MAKSASQRGWITLHKKIMESAVWSDPLRLKAWIHILLSANYEDKEWFIHGRVQKIKRGQFVTSNRKLQEAWNCSQRTVSRILKQLEELDMIKVETPHKRYTLLTVVKYGVYQDRRNSKDYNEGYSEGHSEDYKEGSSEGQQLNNIYNNINNIEQSNNSAPRFDPGGYEIEE